MTRTNINFFALLELITCLVCIFTLGFFNFLGLVFGGMIVGMVLLSFSFKNLATLRGEPSLFYLISQAGVCFAGVLFLIPGILSSLGGILVLLASLIMRALGPKRQEYFENHNSSNNYEDDIIDVEIIEDKK